MAKKLQCIIEHRPTIPKYVLILLLILLTIFLYTNTSTALHYTRILNGHNQASDVSHKIESLFSHVYAINRSII